MAQDILRAYKHIQRAQLVGTIIFLLLFIAKKNPFWAYQYEALLLFASLNAFVIIRNAVLLYLHRNLIPNFQKLRTVLILHCVFVVILLLLCGLEVFIKYTTPH